MKKYLIPLGLALASGAVLAQQVPNLSQYLAEAGTTDWSMRFWSSVLGDFAQAPWSQAGGPTTVLGRLFLVFNSAIFAVATVWLGYSIIVGIVGTAQDGVAMGKRINTAWFPIRSVVGLAGATPLLAGFTLAQAALMSTAALGVGIANYMYKAAVNDPQLTQLVGTGHLNGAPAVSRSELELAVTAMLKGHVCMLAYGRIAQEGEAAGVAPTPDLVMMARADATNDGMIIKYGSRPNPTACGSVSVKMERSRGDSLTSDVRSTVSYRVASVDYDGIRRTVSQRLSQKLIAADKLAAAAAQGYMRAVDEWHRAHSVDQFQWSDSAFVPQAVAAFRGDMKTLVDTSIESGGSSITEQARQNMLAMGWVGAGAWYSTFAEANAALADAVSGTQLAATDIGTIQPSGVAEELNRLATTLERAGATRDESAAAAGDAVSYALKETCAAAPGASRALGTATGNCSLGQQIAQMLIAGTSAHSGGRDLINPIVAMKNTGDYIMTLGSVLVSAQFTWVAEKAAKAAKWVSGGVAATAGAVGLGGVAAAAGNASNLAGGVETVAAHAVPIGWTLMLVGGFLGIYLPLLPFIAWMGAVLTYAASFLEGLIAMPLHSMSHLHTDGEGMGHNTSKGYLFFLNTLARPPLMVISFFVASALVIGVGTLATQLFVPAMASVQGNSVTGLFSIGAYLFIYFILMSSLVQKSFELIEVIPDQVIGFLGAGDIRSSLGHGMEQKINAVFSRVAQGGSMAGQASAAGGNELNKQRAKKQQRD